MEGVEIRGFVYGKVRNCYVYFKGDRIEKVSMSRIPGKKTKDFTKYLALPGLLDPHVHLRYPGETHKEDFKTGTLAAASSGVACVFDMPNNKPPTVSTEDIRRKMKEADRKALIDMKFYIGYNGKNCSELSSDLAVGVKVYLGKTTGDLHTPSVDDISSAFDCADGKMIAFHAEDQEVIESEGRTKRAALEAIRKIASESAGRMNAYVCHATTFDEVMLAKERGLFVEVSPHHLFLSKRDEKRLGNLGLVNPPLRSVSEVSNLWSTFDFIDVIATDHAPHLPEEKEKGACGFPGLDTSLGLMLTALNQGRVTVEQIARKMSKNAAKIFGLRKDYGSISDGKLASIALVDASKEWVVKKENLFTKCGWSPFEGMRLKGRCEMLIHRGSVVFERGVDGA